MSKVIPTSDGKGVEFSTVMMSVVTVLLVSSVAGVVLLGVASGVSEPLRSLVILAVVVVVSVVLATLVANRSIREHERRHHGGNSED